MYLSNLELLFIELPRNVEILFKQYCLILKHFRSALLELSPEL